MRPDDPRPDPRPGFDDLMDAGIDLPFDADLEVLDQELEEAGQQARRMLYGRSHPTRVFSNRAPRLAAPHGGRAARRGDAALAPTRP